MEDCESTTDSHLVNLASQGCEASFRTLFDRYYRAIHSYAWRICNDSTTAEDIAQQTFVKIAAELPHHKNEGKFKAWIYRIALNTARDHLRATQRYRQRIIDLEQSQRQEFESPDKYEYISSLLEKLPLSVREAVLLVHAQGLTQKEAAQVLDCPEGTVSWRIAEARRLLNKTAPLASSTS